MKTFVWFFLFIQIVFAADFDCVIIGSSPIPLFEAIYQRLLGKRVLILEQAKECGGAWKSIEICGMTHVDLGCHQIGGNLKLKEFLETYGGCCMVSMDAASSRNGFYFSNGCHELIHNLMDILSRIGVELLLNHRLESVCIDEAAGLAVLKTQNKQFTTKKIFHTTTSSFQIANKAFPSQKMKYPHLYLLIQDPTEPKFSYMNYSACGASRAMNLTRFVGLENSGRQLIVFQITKESSLSEGQNLLDDLKQRHLVDPSAYILKTESYIYELDSGRPTIPVPFQSYFELLHTSTFSYMLNYLPKWKEVLRAYQEICP